MVKVLTSTSSKNPLFLLAIAMLHTLIFGCAQGKIDPFDRQTGATQKEIRDVFFGDKAKKAANKKAAENSAIPKLNSIPQSSRMIAIPSLPKASAEKLISFSVTDQVPLKDVLIELAKAAKLDVDLDPGIDGGVIVNAKNRPLVEVLDRVCDMGDLRYTLLNNRLHVERDLPFAKNYSLDFLVDGDLWASVETNVLALIDSKNSNSSSSSRTSSNGGSVSSNKLSNMMTIFASQKNHAKVANYLAQVRKSSSAQVLIEAKVIEVTLKDNYKTGIDWAWLAGADSVTQNANGAGGASVDKDPIAFVLGRRGLLGGSITSSVSALEEFGTVKAIASPRINALNNQKATLNFTRKLIYFTNDVSTSVTTSTPGSTSQNTVTSTQHEEPTGTELTITPVIDLATNEITLNVKPKITIKSDDVTQTVVVAGVDEPIINTIPTVNVRELSTTAKIQNGSVLVIGGVMNEDTTNNDNGVPYLSRIPVLGYLFKKTSKKSSVTETVIFVKATIVGTGDGVSKYDRQIHDTFTSSSRPFLDSN